MERKSTTQRRYEDILEGVAWMAVCAQVFLVMHTRSVNGESVVRGIVETVSYFTVLTNLMVVIVLNAAAQRADRANDEGEVDADAGGFLTRPETMTAVAVYIAVVGLTYSLLLRSIWNPTGLQLVVDRALHDAVPVLYVLYWLIFVPKRGLRWSQPLWWLIYPAAYCVYSLVFGMVTGKYMYWFVDPTGLGWPKVLAHLAVLFACFLLLGEIAVGVGRLRRG
jgi:hypothetical protein